MSFENVLITGANRGIGLELVRQLFTTTHAKHVIATTRQSSHPELDQLRDKHPNRLHVLQLEGTNYNSFPEFVKQVFRHAFRRAHDIQLIHRQSMPARKSSLLEAKA